jgi:LCP family protein required for cell wall assembly
MSEKKFLTLPRLRLALWIAFGVAALLTAVLTFLVVRGMVTSWAATSGLPGINIQDATPTPGPDVQPGTNPEVPLDPVTGPQPIPWDGANRVSLLIMGLDYRDWLAGDGPPRTDTMILFTVDPVNQTAGMISIPRDLWVNIPGFDYGRINTAYMLGEGNKLPGGGPQLAADTVEALLGVPVDYYAQIDFSAFIRFIDEIGGIKVQVTERVKVDPLGDDNTKYVSPGLKKMDGALALAYARARKTEGGDFDRALRQQAVVMGIRNRLLQVDNLPRLITKAPVLYQELSSGVRTNLTLDQVIRLAWLASQIPEDKITKVAIGPEQVSFAQSPDGSQEVLKPITEKIRALRDEVFSDTGPASPLAADLGAAELVKLENARVAVLNGSSISGLGARTADYLKSQGINVTQTGNAEQSTVYSEINFYTGKPYTVKFLVDMLQISNLRIRYFFDLTKPVDIELIVGDDWAQKIPSP